MSSDPHNYVRGFSAVTSYSNAWDAVVEIDNDSYIKIQGIKIIDVSNLADGTFAIEVTNRSHNIKLQKISIRNGSRWDSSGCPISIDDGANYILVEDVFICGSMRYGVLIYHPETGSGYHTEKVILRRVVVRFDYVRTNQPLGGIAAYGRNSGTDEADSTVKDVLFQNCLVLDLNPGGIVNAGCSSTPTEQSCWRMYGAFYNPKITNNIDYQGSMVVNFHGNASTDASYSGFYSHDNYLGNDNNDLVDCFAYDVTSSGIFVDEGKSPGTCSINRNTLGLTKYGIIDGTTAANFTITAKNNIFLNNTDTNIATGNLTQTFNVYIPAGQAQGANSSTANPNLLYLPCTTLVDGGDNNGYRGASVEKQYGENGTLWGDLGYDVKTNNALWPWPYEDQIKADFSEANDPPNGAHPAINDTTRGFCAAGQTLTKYIWEYLGNPVPPEIYGSSGITGDLNSDGKVDVTDIQACVNHVLGAQDWGAKADVNSDGAVNVQDVQAIVNIILFE